MANITLDGLPAKTGTISDSGVLHLRESGVDKKVTVSAFLSKISAQYQTFMNTFLGTADKAAARAALDIARRTAVSNADYTILVTDKFVANISALTAARTFTLPSAALYPAGEELVVEDKSFSLTKQLPLTISRAGSDTFNDGSTSQVLDQKGAKLRLISDGVSVWSILSVGIAASSVLFSGRNAIINGAMDVWQRGVSFPSIADGTYHADRWCYNKVGAAVHDISRSTDVPTLAQSGRVFNYSMLLDCQTADASIAAGDLTYIQQRIEGFNWAPLAQKIITLSFWVKATKIGTYCAAIKNSGSDRSYVAEYTVNVTDTWEYKTITFAASPSAGTWDFTNGIGASLIFTIAGGSTYQTTANAWQTGHFFSTSNQVNGTDSTSNNFRICGVQLEAGSVATPFENKKFQQEISDCMRYFEKSYEYQTAPETATQIGQVVYSNQNAQANYIVVKYRVEKRTAPTVTISNPVAAGNSARNYSAGTNLSFTVGDNGASGFSGLLTSTAALSTIGIQWYSSAEL